MPRIAAQEPFDRGEHKTQAPQYSCHRRADTLDEQPGQPDERGGQSPGEQPEGDERRAEEGESTEPPGVLSHAPPGQWGADRELAPELETARPRREPLH